MNYRETVLFVGKCLTLRFYPERIDEVRIDILSGRVAWEQVVWVSTSHYVFPALYYQLKGAGLLNELPNDLVEYMEEFSDTNRERNQLIIDQAHEIASILSECGINAVFLKGTAHLLDGLYEDIGERMVGDIDLLVDEWVMITAAEALIKNGYAPMAEFNPLDLKRTRHYTVLAHPDRRAGVEIHREILRIPNQGILEGKLILQDSRKCKSLNTLFVPKNEHQILHNILGVQLNDRCYYYGSILLRQSYDLFLLSQRENLFQVVKNFGRKTHCLNTNLAATNLLLAHPACVPYQNTWRANLFMSRIRLHLSYPGYARFSKVALFLIMKLLHYPKELVLLVCNKDYRSSLFARLRNPRWYGEHFRRFGKMG